MPIIYFLCQGITVGVTNIHTEKIVKILHTSSHNRRQTDVLQHIFLNCRKVLDMWRTKIDIVVYCSTCICGSGKIPQHLGTNGRINGKEAAEKYIIARFESRKRQLNGKGRMILKEYIFCIINFIKKCQRKVTLAVFPNLDIPYIHTVAFHEIKRQTSYRVIANERRQRGLQPTAPQGDESVKSRTSWNCLQRNSIAKENVIDSLP